VPADLEALAVATIVDLCRGGQRPAHGFELDLPGGHEGADDIARLATDGCHEPGTIAEHPHHACDPEPLTARVKVHAWPVALQFDRHREEQQRPEHHARAS